MKADDDSRIGFPDAALVDNPDVVVTHTHNLTHRANVAPVRCGSVAGVEGRDDTAEDVAELKTALAAFARMDATAIRAVGHPALGAHDREITLTVGNRLAA